MKEEAEAVLLIELHTGALYRMAPTNGRVTHMRSLSTDGRTMAIDSRPPLQSRPRSRRHYSTLDQSD